MAIHAYSRELMRRYAESFCEHSADMEPPYLLPFLNRFMTLANHLGASIRPQGLLK